MPTADLARAVLLGAVVLVGTWLAWRWVHRGAYRRGGEGGPLPWFRWLPLTAPLLGALLAWAAREQPLGAALLAASLAPFALTLVVVDADVRRLPNVLTLPAVPVTLVLLTLAAAESARWGDLRRAILALVLVGGAVVLLALLLGARGIGMGDAKLMLSLAPLLAWHGWATLFVGVYLGFLLGGVAALALLLLRRIERRGHLAFGPYLLVGALAALLRVG